MLFRSNSAKLPSNWNSSLPTGVLVSNGSVAERIATPAPSSRRWASRRTDNDRARRSIRKKTISENRPARVGEQARARRSIRQRAHA